MGFNPLQNLLYNAKMVAGIANQGIDGITSHIPFGVGAKYNQNKELVGDYNYYNSPGVQKKENADILKNRAIAPQSRAAAENWYHTLNEASQRQPLSLDPHTNFMNRQQQPQPANPQQFAQPPGLQVLLNRGQQPFGHGYEDDYTPQQAIQNPGFTGQTPLNGQLIQGPQAQQLRRTLRY